MKLVVGLGNPGEKYEYTRHNAGFLILNAFVAKKVGDGIVWLSETKFNAHVYREEGVIYAKPQTFMNRVGESVSKLVHFYNIDLSNLLVIHDDVDLIKGEFKLKKGSQAAGHHGVEDIFSKLGTSDFFRLRMGVGRPLDKKYEVEDYVLEKFSDEEISNLKDLFEKKIYDKIDGFLNL
ncbi:aminoacyl-tRNA hydrolase [candidate division WWE3 bacterium RIFCSPHIGHO2_01_FULL_40_23]|uniref:Peptidyl-tRNA hydrolase n=1 Tax=candidate division WWE3 bacterium RIFCSPLOWO2_01_FULL_41_18 TaxID=1802625 RepID=A0A1F4VEU2_UNCKA|nr:MAG: aminoacyl-tRNA hydrolase [candidate division WWE3 bacterium RIFCSPHIGHO2_01_FULL_40_23]OGC55488.1 MAG: aminoacyl-tRNA hydrolase [candidate division WWE3 bacterium RIFCSPLOWO2_01_FULL_41_18]